MSLFYNDNKPGRGISKNEPEKKGIMAYFSLLWRYLSRLTTANLLYFFVGLPILIIYSVISFYFVTIRFPEITDSVKVIQLSIDIAFSLFVILGAGPISCGYTYILRNCARGEHTFVTSDFFEKTKQNFKLSIIAFLVDIVFLLVNGIALTYYHNLATKGSMWAFVSEILVVLIIAVYFMMHYYLYELMVTFYGGLLDLSKKSLIFAFGMLPVNVLYTAFVVLVMFKLFNTFTPFALIPFFAIIGVSLFRFPIDFYVARKIKKLNNIKNN